jgi:hypothetical protein
MWYYTLNNQQFGPVDEAKIKELVAAGSINGATMVWTAGMASWLPITQSPLAGLVGNLPPAPPPMAYGPVKVVDPRVQKLNDLFLWFWITLAGSIITFGVSAMASLVLFFIIIYKAWQLVQDGEARTTADQAVAYCGIPGWQFYWIFIAFKQLAREMNRIMAKEQIAGEPVKEDTALWFCIMILASPLGITVIPLIVFWIIFTNQVKKAAIAITEARK